MSKNTICTLVLFFFSLLLLSSCVATRQDILSLNRRIMALNRDFSNIGSVRERQAEAGAEMDGVKQDLLRISGELEGLQHLIKHSIESDTIEQDALNARLAKVEKRIAKICKSFNLELAQASQRTSVEMAPQKVDAVLVQQSLINSEKSGSSENKFYEETLVSYRAGKYEEVITGFKDFLKKHPESELADNAQFWIGESYLALKKYDNANKAYLCVIEKYPQGNKVPNAMLKMALTFYEKGDKKAASIMLRRVMKKFPGSSEANLAEAKLETFKGRGEK